MSVEQFKAQVAQISAAIAQRPLDADLDASPADAGAVVGGLLRGLVCAGGDGMSEGIFLAWNRMKETGLYFS